VVTLDFRAIHHHSLELIKDPETWTLAYIRLVEKWNGQLPDTGTDPERRALRAEAEAACARGISVSNQLRNQAIRRELARVERERDSARRQLDVTRQALEAARHERSGSGAGPDAEAAPAERNAGKLVAIDHAVERLEIESFASLEIAQAFGQYAFYTIGKPTVQRGTLIDVRAWRPRGQLLSAMEYAAEHPGMEVLDGSFADPDTVTELGQVDAILLHDVLLRLVDPDWDQVLKLYAPATSSFVIVNPQWERGATTIRLIDLGRERYLQAVPPWPSHIELFDHLDEWNEAQERPYRDGNDVWQWGITDTDLKAKMGELGFSLEREWRLNAPPDTEGLGTKAFAFIRAEPSEPADDNQASQE
jgi:hypothetical protein